MRRLTAIAAMVLVAGVGCSASDDDGSDGGPSVAPAPTEAPTAHESVTEPFQLDIQAPDGFSAEAGDRDALVADEHQTYEFALTDGNAQSRLYVTSYLLPEDVDTADYDAQVALVLEYDQARGNGLSAEKHSPTLVHGYAGVYRYANYEIGGDEVKQQNHYLFADRHLIQITCQWNFDFNQVYQGCMDLTTSFAYPAEWPVLP